MVIVPEPATDELILSAVEGWLRLLEKEDYDTAAATIVSPPDGVWTAELLQGCVNQHGYGRRAHYRVTLTGVSRELDIGGRVISRIQRREVERFPPPDDGDESLEVWYDLYLDGELSDLTATFGLARVPEGLALQLNNIRVK